MKNVGHWLFKTRAGNRLLGFGLPTLGSVAWLLLSAGSFRLVGRFPPCAFYRMTGLHCVGCGATRMLQSLLDGQIKLAFSYNPLLFLAIAGACLLSLWWGVRTFLPRWKPWRLSVRSYWWLLVPVALVVFFVVRNLPWYRAVLF